MKTLYIECSMGAAGDMLGAALLEIYGDRQGFIDMINNAGIEGVSFKAEDSVKCGIIGTKLHVIINGKEEHEHHHEHSIEHGHEHHHEHHSEHGHGSHHEHHHASYESILKKISEYNIPDKVKADASEVYRLIGEAEARVHGKKLENIHFHEVGTLDAVADVICSCWLMRLIAPEKVICSPVCTGSGTVHCAHGVLPVPAPAAALLLQGIPIYSGHIKSELITPTGAAIIKHFADSFGEMPVMTIDKIGSGMGTKEFEQANCVRIFSGETENDDRQRITVIRCSIDDMTGEDLGYACEKLMSGGALDVFTVPIYMKKSRPGILLVCSCENRDRERLIKEIFKHTTTRGLRYSLAERARLKSDFFEKETEYGTVTIKRSEGFGASYEKPEFESLKKIADEMNVSIKDIRKSI